MKVPVSWLKDYVEIDCSTQELAHKMTMSGSNVEGVEYLGEEITNCTVGRILSVEQHKNADKLVVTKVDIGKGEPVQIVTGAPNIKAGQLVPVALDGATLAKGIKIKSSSLRGEASEGMLCSIEELGYTRQDYPEAPENGIYIFQEEHPVGSDPKEILQLTDDVIEFEITSNRSDCFSVVGLAREAAATLGKKFRLPMQPLKEEGQGNIGEMVSVEIKNPELCRRYIARVVQDVKIEPSPQWLRHRLTAAGLRPINNIVDITNYVMLELGQPLHAFDINCIADKKIIVRTAGEGEEFTTLDGVTRNLSDNMLVIADPTKAVALAGIMGGENSKILEDTTTILFESANFEPINNRRTSKKLRLRTDSSAKYEKGLDPNLSLAAINRAVELVELLGCGKVVKGMVDCYPNQRVEWTVAYSPERINRLMGTSITEREMEEYLALLEIKAEHNVATIPTFRPDITIEEDIAEEIARLYGYENIQSTLVEGKATVGKKSFTQELESVIQGVCVSYGLCEALSFSFESPKVFDSLLLPQDSKLRDTVKIINPLGQDFSIMRTTTLPAMLSSLALNYNRRNSEAGLFEIANVYLPKALPLTEQPVEMKTLTIGMYGKKDFYDMKGIVEGLLELLLIKNTEFLPVDKNSGLDFMHGGRTAEVFIDGKRLGYLGEVHPKVLENYEIGARVYVAVLNLQLLFEHATMDKSYTELPRFPAMERDIAIVVKDEVYALDIEKAIMEKGGSLLEKVTLFDFYKGSQIEEGKKSLAYNISFRAPDRTLTEPEVTKIMQDILKNLEEKVGATTR